MSVFVKGMQMPTSCVDCPFGLNGWPDERIIICTRLGRLIGDPEKKKPEGIQKDCPLVEAPASHGRFIDADALPHYTGYALSASEVAKAVEAAPTIIEAEKGEE